MKGSVNIKQIAHDMGAKSIELLSYGRTWTHVCWTGGQLAKMSTVQVHTLPDGTRYGMCQDCKRFFYSPPRKVQPQQRVKQFVYA
jgi:hypothetical protein